MRFLIGIFCIFMILLSSSFFVVGQESEEDAENPSVTNRDTLQEHDWSYYFALPISLILIFILMVIMLFRVRELK